MENTTISKNYDLTLSRDQVFDGMKEGYLSKYDESKDVIVHFVSRKKANEKFKVGGVLDNEQSNNWKAWLYLGPVLILLVVFLLYPLINTIFISFLDNYSYIDGSFDGVTLDNFGVIFGLTEGGGGGIERNFVNYAIPNTFIIVFLTVPLSTLIALLISVALNSIKWFQKFLQTVFFLPYVTNAIAIGMVFSVMFDQNGVINFIFNSDIQWINGADRWTAMVPLCFYIIWSSIPFKILVFLSGLQGIDKQYYDAAKVDGSSHSKILWRITVPLMSPQIMYIIVTSFIGAFKEYTSIVALFNGPGTSNGSYNMYTIVYYIYDNLQGHTSYAAAAAVFLFVVILIFTALQLWVSKKRVHY